LVLTDRALTERTFETNLRSASGRSHIRTTTAMIRSILPLLSVIFAALVALAPGLARAQGAPFPCNDDLYQVRAGSGGNPNAALLRFPQSLLTTGGTATNVWGGLNSPGVNALGFRAQDGFLYGIVSTQQQPVLARYGASTGVVVGTIVTAGAQTPALTATFTPTGGTFDAQGRYYFAGQGGGNIAPAAVYRVDSFADIDPGAVGVQIGVAAIFPLSATLTNIGDIAFGPDGNLYGATATTLAQIVLPITTGTATVNTRTIATVGGIGSAFFSNAGVLYVYDNATSQLRSVTIPFGNFGSGTITVGSPVTINGAPPVPGALSSTDGASCVTPPQADVRVTKTNTPLSGPNDQPGDTVTGSANTVYSIIVSNVGPAPASNSVVTDPAPAGLSCSAITCAAAGGASCPVLTGAALIAALQGSGAVIPVLPNGGTVTFALTCAVP
jgi:uncharacterized repeat protein (TIGR01451 family)